MKNLMTVLAAVLMVSLMSCEKEALTILNPDCDVEADTFLGAYELDEASRLYLPQEEGQAMSFENQDGVIIEMEQTLYNEETLRKNATLLCTTPSQTKYYEYYEVAYKEVTYSATLSDGSNLRIGGQAFVDYYFNTDGLYDQVIFNVSKGATITTFSAFPHVHQGEVNPNINEDVDTELYDVSLNNKSYTGVLIHTTIYGKVYVHPQTGLVAFEFEDGSVYTKM